MTHKRKTKGKPDQIDCYVGAQIRKSRITQGISQGKLAESIGLTFQQIQKYEKGINRVSCGRLWQLSAALDRPLLYFFPDQSDDFSAAINSINSENEGLKAKLSTIKEIASA